MSNPVLLVHGFLSVKAAMIPLQRMLRSRGVQAHCVDLPPLCIQDVRVLGAHLARAVAKYDGPVDLVGVSQGGLAALAYMRLLGGQKDVRRFVAIGTPFQGTWFALVGVPLFGPISTGVWQSLPNSELLKELRQAGHEEEDIISISRHGDPVAPPDRCWLPNSRQVVLPRGFPGAVHQRLALSPTTADAVKEALSRP